MSSVKCVYGCGNEGKYILKNGKYCCSKFVCQCEIIRNKNSKTNKGKNNHFYGKKHTIESKIKNSIAHTGKKIPSISGDKNPAKRLEVRKKISEGNTGKKRTEEHKRKISEAISGSSWGLHTEETKKKISKKKYGYIWGSHTEESKKKMSELKKGENHPNWKGGISDQGYCPIWSDKEYKKYIKNRDNNQCLNPICNKKSNRLCIHHINYDKKDCKPSNLITVCTSCNTKANYDRKWHKSWYQTILFRRYNVK